MRNLLVFVAAVGAAGLAPAQDTAGETADRSPQPLAQPQLQSGMQASQTPVKKDPRTAVQDIQRALRTAEDVPADAISVTLHAETVVLSGEVDSQVQAAKALSLAQQHAGDVKVSSHVEVKAPAGNAATPATSGLVREVERALKADRRTANLGVAVSIDAEQVIGLHGLVPTRESRAAAEEIAARVDGVQSVSSRLMVAGE